MKNLLLCVFFLSLLNSLQAGGPWPQPKGEAYIKLYQWWIDFDQHYTTNGEVVTNNKTGIYNTVIYGEFGISDKFTLLLNFPIRSQFKSTYYYDIDKSSTYNFITRGDTELGVKYGITKKGASIPISASFILGMPFGKRDYTSDGEVNTIFQLEGGKSYKISSNISGFTSLLAAYNIRSNGFSDDYRFGIESGLGFLKNNLLFTARFYNLNSIHNSKLEYYDEHYRVSIFENNTEYSSYSFELAYYLYKGLGISANYASAFRGEWIAAAPAYSFGVFYDFNR